MTDERITWYRGKLGPGPCQTIGVLEVRACGACRAVFAERAEIDGRAHIQLARRAWGPKDALETRWWSLVLDWHGRVCTVRTGSCGDPLTSEDVPRVLRALEDLALVSEDTMIEWTTARPSSQVGPGPGGSRAKNEGGRHRFMSAEAR